MTNSIFLSASIPLQERDNIFFETADVVAIRESIIALVSVVCPNKKLVYGGHPAITPLVNKVAREFAKSCITVYQSEFFRNPISCELSNLSEVILVSSIENSSERSLEIMREKMIGDTIFDAAFFIGGMEGVEKEYQLFRRMQPCKPAFPIASTGAAALKLYQQNQFESNDLLEDLQYLSLFRRLLGS